MIIKQNELIEWILPNPEVFYIYFLYYKDEIVYIGQTQSIGRRIEAHKKDKLFDRAMIKEYNDITRDEILEIERSNITQYNPIFNDNLKMLKRDEFVYIKGIGKFETGIFYQLNPIEDDYHYYDGNNYYTAKKKFNFIEISINLVVTEKVIMSNLYNYTIYFNDAENSYTTTKQKVNESNLIFKKGKYQGNSLAQVRKINPSYIDWSDDNVINFTSDMLYVK